MASEAARQPGPTGGVAFAVSLYRVWWFIALQAGAAVVVLVVVLSVTGRTSYEFTGHFVLHPDPTSNTGDVANSISVLSQDGPLVQTVLKVLGNDEILRRAGAAAGVPDTSRYAISATVSPGSSFFDAVVRGPDRRQTEAVGRSFETVASSYVEKGYHGFRFDVLGSDVGTHNSFPPSPSLLVLVLLLGAVAAAGELFVLFALGHLRAIAALDAVMGAFDPVEAASAPDQDRAEIKSPAANGQRARRAATNGEIAAEEVEDPSLEGANDSGGNGAGVKKAPAPGPTSKAVRKSNSLSGRPSAGC